MIVLIRTNSTNTDFFNLVKLLDEELAIRDGEDHSFYNQFNKIDKLNHVVIAFENKKALACGAMKQYNETAMEIKRMFTSPEARGKGLASQILNELEMWAKELGYKTCVLETGIRQPEAIALYQKIGYKIIDNYGQYAGINTSVCFQKELK